MAGRNKLTFEAGPGVGGRIVKHLAPVEVFLAAGVVDGEGNTSNRIVLKAEGDTQFYFMFPKGTEETMKPVAGWLQTQLEVALAGSKAVIPEDPVKDLPTDPMEV